MAQTHRYFFTRRTNLPPDDFIKNHLRNSYHRLLMTPTEKENFVRVVRARDAPRIMGMAREHSLVHALAQDPAITNLRQWTGLPDKHLEFLSYDHPNTLWIGPIHDLPEMFTVPPLFARPKRKVVYSVTVRDRSVSEHARSVMNPPMCTLSNVSDLVNTILPFMYANHRSAQRDAQEDATESFYLLGDEEIHPTNNPHVHCTLLEMVVMDHTTLRVHFNFLYLVRDTREKIENLYDQCRVIRGKKQDLDKRVQETLQAMMRTTLSEQRKKNKQQSKTTEMTPYLKNFIKQHASHPRLQKSLTADDKAIYDTYIQDIRRERQQIIQKQASILTSNPRKQLRPLVEKKRQQNKEKYYYQYVFMNKPIPDTIHRSYKKWLLGEKEKNIRDEYVYHKFSESIPQDLKPELRSQIQQKRRLVRQQLKKAEQDTDGDMEGYIWVQLKLWDTIEQSPIKEPVRSPNNPSDIYEKRHFVDWIRKQQQQNKTVIIDFSGVPITDPRVLRNPGHALPVDQELVDFIENVKKDMAVAEAMGGLRDLFLLRFLDQYRKKDGLYQNIILKKTETPPSRTTQKTA